MLFGNEVAELKAKIDELEDTNQYLENEWEKDRNYLTEAYKEISILKNKNADQALLIANLSVGRVLDEEFHTMTRRNQ